MGLEEPSGLTVGPSLIGRPVRAWMTTKAGLAEMTGGQAWARHHMALVFHHRRPMPLPESPHNPTGNSICLCCSSALIKERLAGAAALQNTPRQDRCQALRTCHTLQCISLTQSGNVQVQMSLGLRQLSSWAKYTQHPFPFLFYKGYEVII